MGSARNSSITAKCAIDTKNRQLNRAISCQPKLRNIRGLRRSGQSDRAMLSQRRRRNIRTLRKNGLLCRDVRCQEKRRDIWNLQKNGMRMRVMSDVSSMAESIQKLADNIKMESHEEQQKARKARRYG